MSTDEAVTAKDAPTGTPAPTPPPAAKPDASSDAPDKNPYATDGSQAAEPFLAEGAKKRKKKPVEVAIRPPR